MDPLTNMKINILNWNADSIQPKIHQLYTFLIENSIDVACLQETMLNPNFTAPSHPDYKIYRLDREVAQNVRQSGGVAILVHRKIRHQLLPTLNLNLIEAIGVKVILNNGSQIEVWSAYLPGGATRQLIQQHYKNDLRTFTNRRCSYFINGDFNSKHSLWNCIRANLAGKILHEEFSSRSFIILHPSTPTHFPANNNCMPSTIDLTLTNGLHDTTDFETHTSSSNHEIVTFSIILSDAIPYNSPHKVPNYSMTDWNLYQQTLQSLLINHQLPSYSEITNTDQIDEIIDFLSESILKSQREAVPLVHKVPYAVTLTSTIKNKIQQRNTLKRQAQRNPAIRNQLQPLINQLMKEIQSEIQNIVNENFQHKLSTIDNSDSNK